MIKKKTIKALSFLWTGSLLGSGSTFVIYIILARELGVEAFGVFSSAFAIATMLSIIAGFGVSQAWLKHFGKEGWSARRWLLPSYKLALYSIIFVLSVLFMWAYFGPNDDVSKNILYILSVFVVGQMIIELVSVKFQLEEKYSILAIWQILPNLSRLFVIVFIVYILSTSINILEVTYIYAIVSLILIIIGIYQLYLMNTDSFNLKGHDTNIDSLTQAIPSTKEVFSHSWAFGLGSIFAFIYLQSDIIMLKYMVGNQSAGLYNVGFIIMSAILVFPTVLYTKFLMPKYHRWANQDKNKFYKYYKKGNIMMFVFGMIALIIVIISSGFFIPILFGEEYLESILLVKVLSVTLPIYFVAYSVGATLVTKDNMKYKVLIMGITALINIILNIILIPKYNEIGAAVATIISNFVLLVLYFVIAETKIFKRKIKYVESC